jgi:hypothetical protein
MEQQSKYYTPDISELHIVYECEHTTCKGAFDINLEDDIVKDKLTVDDLRKYLRYCGIHGDNVGDYIRTRYLDQSDIESLGWKFDAYKADDYKYYLNSYALYFPYADEEPLLITHNKSAIFFGECKSINELKIVMKLIGITV